MPFGLTNALATFQALMNKFLGVSVNEFLVVYLDNILIYSKNKLNHDGHVKEVLWRLCDNNLYVKGSKCVFHAKEVTFLGCVLNADGLTMDTEKFQKILNLPAPLTV